MSLDIALLTYSTKPRGSVVHTCELAIALTQLGHQVCIYALDKDGLGFERELPCKVRLIPSAPAPNHAGWADLRSTDSIAAGLLHLATSRQQTQIPRQNKALLHQYFWEHSALLHLKAYETLGASQ